VPGGSPKRAVGAHPLEPAFRTIRVWQNAYMKRPFSATVWREADWWVSQCLDVDIASQGSTEELWPIFAKRLSSTSNHQLQRTLLQSAGLR